MNELQFLFWVRGPALQISATLFLIGIMWRLIEIYSLRYHPNFAEPRRVPGASGWHTLYRRFFPPEGMFEASPITYIGGYIFHIGLAIIIFLFDPHLGLIKEFIGISWNALPSPIIDFVTVVTLVAMVTVLANRLKCPVKRFLSGGQEYFSWVVTFLPVLTGYLAANHLLFSYTTTLALHILSAELLLISIPFSNLLHIFTVWPSRWFNGAVNGQRGVPV